MCSKKREEKINTIEELFLRLQEIFENQKKGENNDNGKEK